MMVGSRGSLGGGKWMVGAASERKKTGEEGGKERGETSTANNEDRQGQVDSHAVKEARQGEASTTKNYRPQENRKGGAGAVRYCTVQ